jgi:hypothetical protein
MKINRRKFLRQVSPLTAAAAVRGDELMDEQGQPASIFQSTLCQEWEAARKPTTVLATELLREQDDADEFRRGRGRGHAVRAGRA